MSGRMWTLAEQVIAADDEVDGYFDRIKAHLIDRIAKDVDDGEATLDLLMIAKYYRTYRRPRHQHRRVGDVFRHRRAQDRGHLSQKEGPDMIWCVEDDASIRDIELYALRSAGLEAEGFTDGAAFWQALQSEKPDLVVLDVMLPGIDGTELLGRMRASHVPAPHPGHYGHRQGRGV